MKISGIFLESLLKEARVKEVSKTLFRMFSEKVGTKELKDPSTEIGKAYSEYTKARSNINYTDEADYAKKELLKKIAYSFLQKAYETVGFPLPENLKYQVELDTDRVYVLSKDKKSDQAIESYFNIKIVKPERGPLKMTIDPEDSYIKHTDNSNKDTPKEYNLWVPSKMAGKLQKYYVGVKTKGEAPKSAPTGTRSLYNVGQADYKEDVKIDLENKDRIQAVKDLDYPWEEVIGQYFPADDSKEPQNENEAKSVAEDVALVAMTISKTLGALTDLLTDVDKGNTKSKIVSASDKDWYQIEAIFYLDVLKESFPIVRVVVFVNKEDYSVDPDRLKIFITGTQVWP
jgi:hypothetical protein